jgi:LysM repeat protein
MVAPMKRPFGRRAARVAAVAVLGVAVLGTTSCSDPDSSATVSTVAIQPSSYVVKEPATTTTVPAVVEPDAEGRSPVEQTFVISSTNDVPYNIANLYDVDLDELRRYNQWEEGTFAGFPGVGGTVRIPPGAKFIDPAATTTTTPSEESSDTTAAASEGEASGDRCSPTYVVEDGDAPLVITRKFDITLDALNAVNTATPDWPNLYTGRTINLPPPADCAGAVTATTTAG